MQDFTKEQNVDPKSISIREITEDNFEAVVSMKRPDGEKFVAPNSYSLAQAWLYRENNDVFPYAIYCGENSVGFLLLERIMKSGSYAYGESCSRRKMPARATEQPLFKSFWQELKS